jgi:outer membrane protein assembly factor BamB
MCDLKMARHLVQLRLLVGVLLLSLILAACTTLPPVLQDEGPPPGATPHFEGLQEADGVAYLLTGNTLSALQATSGKLLWQFRGNFVENLGYAPPPTLANGLVYLNVNVTSSSASERGEWVYALRGTDGKQFWRFRVSSTFPQILPPGPQVTGGAVFVQTAGQTYGATLFVLNASDGHLLWSQAPSSNHVSPTLLRVSDGIAYLSTSDAEAGYLQARQLNTGRLLWQYRVHTCSIGQFILQQGVVYISDLGACAANGNGWGSAYALGARDGKVRWSFTPGGLLTVSDEVVTVDDTGSSTPGSDTLYVLQASTGQLLWHFSANKGVGSPGGIWVQAVDHTGVYVTINQQFAAFAAHTGQRLWAFPAASQALELGLPIPLPFSQGLWYLPFFDRTQPQLTLAAVQAATGTTLWSQSFSDRAIRWDALLVTEGFIVLRSVDHDDQVETFSASDGRPLWTYQPPGRLIDLDFFGGMAYIIGSLTTIRGPNTPETPPVLTALQASDGHALWTFQPPA